MAAARQEFERDSRQRVTAFMGDSSAPTLDMDRRGAWGGSPTFRLVALAAFLVVAGIWGFYVVFGHSFSVDEGYLLITVRGFLEGHPLFDSVFTQYGPFYYVYEWLIHGVLRIPLTHDATRLVCLVDWLLASSLLAMAAGRLTRSFFAGVFVFAQAVVHLQGLANEPGHPQEFVTVLLALAAYIAAGTQPGGKSWPLLAFIAAGLVFVKINVGGFFCVALLMATANRDARIPKIFKYAATALAIVVPFLLMRRHIALEWCHNLGIAVACSLACSSLAAIRFAEKSIISLRAYIFCGALFIAGVLLSLGTAIASGTTVHGLMDGMLFTPLNMASNVLLTGSLPTPLLLSAAAALTMACLAAAGRVGEPVIAALKVLYATLGVTLLGQPDVQLAILIPWVWLVVIPAGGQPASPFGRIFLALAAGVQALQAYPVAGTQVTISTALLVVTYAVALGDALRTLSGGVEIRNKLARLTPPMRSAVHATLIVTLLLIFAFAWCDLPGKRAGYAKLTPLALPGCNFIRMDQTTAKTFQDLAAYLERESDTFISFPCLNSLYFWTSKRPPTQMNGAGWLQFSHQQQEAILHALCAGSRPRILIGADVRQALGTHGDQLAPLIEFLKNDCEELTRIGKFTVLAPRRIENRRLAGLPAH